jgi:hypothetical protein
MRPWPGLCLVLHYCPDPTPPSSQGPLRETPIVVVDTVGLGDPAVPANVQHRELRNRLAWIEALAQTAYGRPPRFALFLVLGVQGRFTEDDVAGVSGLKEVFGSAFLAKMGAVWTHTDLLGQGGLAAHVAGLQGYMQEVVHLTCSSVLLNNMLPVGEESHRQQVAALIQAADRHAMRLPKPTGKFGKRMRQQVYKIPQHKSVCEKVSNNCTIA